VIVSQIVDDHGFVNVTLTLSLGLPGPLAVAVSV
jgi:hypothetical protein